jgi:hypothetical protein
MKTTITILCLGILVNCRGQKFFDPTVALKGSPTSLMLGNAGIHAEYSFSAKRSLTGKIGFPVAASHKFKYQGEDANFKMKATSFMTGFRNYFSPKKKMQGFYIEPYFKYVHHTAEGLSNGNINYQHVQWDFTNDYNAFGVGSQLGYQFIIRKRFVIDLFFAGLEINNARSNFKAIEISNSVPWTAADAREAESDIRNFLNQFPYIRNSNNVMVDTGNKTVTVDFKGAIPGIRTGFSIGYAF